MFADTVIIVRGLINGGATGFDNQYVVEFDAGRDGIEPLSGLPIICHLVTTPDIDKATRFPFAEAVGLWRSVDPRIPVRPDGKPNRPFTAFSIEMFKPELQQGDSA